MKTASSLLTIIASTLLSVACASDEPEQSKATPPEWLPELPLTVERIEAFADPKDLALLKQTSAYQSNSKEFFYRTPVFFEDYGVFETHYFLVPLLKSSAYFWEVDRGEWNNALMVAGGPTYPAWGPNGELLHHTFFQMTEKDFDLINQLEHLTMLVIREEVMEGPIDLALLSEKLPLRSLAISTAQIENPNAVCKYPNMEFIELWNIRFYGDIDTNGCSESLMSISLSGDQIDSLTIRDLPNLRVLHLSESNMDELVIDGRTLPELESVALEEADLPADLSQVELPEELVQLMLNGLTYAGKLDLKLPENLEFLSLRDAQLDDYSFIVNAKNLKHLDLAGSNFNQWSLLSKLKNLEHILLASTSLTDDDLVHLSGLENLQTLTVASTAITTLMPVKDLKSLNRIDLYNTRVTDMDKIPYIENLSYFGLPNEGVTDLPEHIQKMQENTLPFIYYCNGLKPCSVQAWSPSEDDLRRYEENLKRHM